MKSPVKLQQKLKRLLSKSKLHIGFDFDKPWDDLILKEVAWVVQDHVNHSPEVIECDPLKDWLDEYRFSLQDLNNHG
jgi:hypothetical protein